ncbi:3'(2'),5'-bisphosphate nucleotidase CysQ [Acidithiobacillus ferrooxidans]|uniref:3'(2'),5'-bisphosphate nucleotidase CysQ n=1 Tax=Acidithiobacillus ferrooxidans TaxID=920 RepID=UPI001D04CAA8|nr:3'(2'),5'-bisphosphate nucleotidase CysQ [Acidithiobacillus ferrooxidans]
MMADTIDMERIIAIAKEAGDAIMEIYQRDFTVDYKEDSSPLTDADRAAHGIILRRLHALYPEIPFLSEEGDAIPYEIRKHWEAFWLVDPLDGTKEFIRKNGEYTVNIALIENDRPVLGVVYAPALDRMYYAKEGAGAWRQDAGQSAQRLPLRMNKNRDQKLTVVASKSHRSPETAAYIDELEKSTHELEVVSIGSSLKICLVAEGYADCYPRLGPTMEWDTAAAQIIATEGGCRVEAAAGGHELVYNKKDLSNPYFVVEAMVVTFVGGRVDVDTRGEDWA